MNKTTSGTIIRTTILVIAIANNALALAGKSPLPIDDAMVEQVVSFCATATMALITWYKNNSFTQPAIEADMVMKELKAQKKGK